MPTLNFTVDSALLRELGERVVGKPYIALAELVKNSYDADATEVTIELDSRKGVVAVSDNGHGMDLKEFNDFWMRIGSIHKVEQRVSRGFRRSMTGSKGIGRLAVQTLAGKLDLSTVSDKDERRRLTATVDWEKAVSTGDITQASVEYTVETSDKQFSHGTSILLTGLRDKWGVASIEKLAEEIWWLSPPFRSTSADPDEKKKVFKIKFLSVQEDYIRVFNQQLRAIMEIWTAKLVGENRRGEVNLALEFAGKKPIITKYVIPDCDLRDGDFEIRIYHLVRRQPEGIRVKEARDYFLKFGGVHVYDGGFHLPYYGNPENDWLHVEYDQSHRRTLSRLLPPELQVPAGMTFLPTLGRVFGVVNVSTSKEKNLRISVTRDRFEETRAFSNLSYMVRWAIDFYARTEALRSQREKRLKGKIEPIKVERIEDVLHQYESRIPTEVYRSLCIDMKTAVNEIETEAEVVAGQVGLMGSLATAGMSSLAYQHELKQQLNLLRDYLGRVDRVKTKDKDLVNTLTELKEDLTSWIRRVESTSAIFSYLADTENLQQKERHGAKALIKSVAQHVGVFARGVPIEISRIDAGLLLPKASWAEWESILQNVFINSFNAMIDSDRRIIDVSSRSSKRFREIMIQDTGYGVNLADSEELFEPFVRKTKLSPERKALGYGGSGLGLTIVRAIATNMGCRVSFVKPENGFKTAFLIRWSEAE
jgi:signal transduction histidine kinase